MNFSKLYKTALWAALTLAPLAAEAALPQGVVYMGPVTTAEGTKVYFSVNSQGREMSQLSIEYFDNELTLNSVAVIDLLPLLQHNGEAVNEVVAMDVPKATTQSIFRVTRRFADETEATISPYSSGTYDIVYWTDIMGHEPASGSTGNRRPVYDRSYGGNNNGQLRIGNQVYAKGISIPTNLGAVNFRTTGGTLENFVRFKADYGRQYPLTGINTRLLMTQDPGAVWIVDCRASENVQRWDFPITTANPASGRMTTMSPITFWTDNNPEVTIGAPRFYTANYELNRQPQTVTLSNVGGTLPFSTHSVTLSATAQAAGPVTYRLTAGQDLATLEGNVLSFKHGKAGTVSVEAYSLGDGSYQPAVSATVSYTFDRTTWAEILTTAPDANGRLTRYATVNPKGEPFAELAIEAVDELTLTVVEQQDLLPMLGNQAGDDEEIVNFDLPLAPGTLYRLRYRMAGDEQPRYGFCHNGTNEVHYWTEVMGNVRASTSCSYVPGAYVNQGPNGETLQIGSQTYAKGLCLPSGANVQNTRAEHLRGYTRFRTDVGFQYGTANYNSGTIRFIISTNGRNIFDSQVGGAVRKFDYGVSSTPANDQLDARGALSFWTSAGRNLVLGAPRFDRETNFRAESQTLSWPDESFLQVNRPTAFQLKAASSAGVPVHYRVVEGADFVRVVDGDKMEIFQIPDVDATIVIEASQPGTHLCNPAQPVNHTFKIEHSLVVNPGERVVLDRDETLQEIVIYGNREAVGQVAVEGAMINARKIILKYTFVPGEWHHLVFPSDINLDVASDLLTKGYTLNNPNGRKGSYHVQSFDTRRNATNPDESPWTPVDEPTLKGRTGYVMKLSDKAGKEPVEVSFVIDNEQLNLDRESLPMILALDVSSMRPFTSQDVYVKAIGAASNTLKIKVDFRPENPDELPVNHALALESMRVTVSPEGSALRLTLPNQDEARVVIMDRKGSKLLKAVKYTSPNAIDISDLRPGQYRMAIRYGNATATRTFTVPKR